MKKTIITLIALTIFGVLAVAQPRAIGVRGGVPGFNSSLDVSYEHYMSGSNFLEFNGGLDYGRHDQPGFKATGIYNFMIAEPSWTSQGEWGIYAGPGVFVGYADDQIDNSVVGHKLGIMAGIAAQVGLEYTFWFPLQLSVDIRPYAGLHIYDLDGIKIGKYENGRLGLYPTVTARYRF